VAHAEGVAATLGVEFSADVATGGFDGEDDAGGGVNDQTVVVQRGAALPPPRPRRLRRAELRFRRLLLLVLEPLLVLGQEEDAVIPSPTGWTSGQAGGCQ